jgi:hypothetical protein
VYTVVETPLFQRLADNYWSEEERSAFVSFIADIQRLGTLSQALVVCARYAGAWLAMVSGAVCA